MFYQQLSDSCKLHNIKYAMPLSTKFISFYIPFPDVLVHCVQCLFCPQYTFQHILDR